MSVSNTRTEQWSRSRNVRERIFISGMMVLVSPTHLGNGDTSGVTDIGLLRDALDGQPLLTGASLAGALRNYIREVELGYGVPEAAKGQQIVEQLFGYVGEDVADAHAKNRPVASIESWLMIDDARGVAPNTKPIEIRDGVALNAATRTPADGKKYDIELLAAGTTFPLHFELWLPDGDAALRKNLLNWLALALNGLERGHIHLGMRKRRGFGRCKVTGWRVNRFAMDNANQVGSWLDYTVPAELEKTILKPGIADLLRATLPVEDARESFRLEATFHLSSSLLIRADSGKADAPDMSHLTNAAGQPILSGTSLAGSVRARAKRIASTVLTQEVAANLVNGMFGWHEEEHHADASGSRVIVQESVIRNPIMDRVQSRVKLDRFTGGAFPQALFSQMPLFARTEEPTTVKIELALQKLPPHRFPKNDDDPAAVQVLKQQQAADARFAAEVGLLLLVLKDLWTEDLPLGGERSVGRGRLRGQSATLTYRDKRWQFEADNSGKLRFSTGLAEELEEYVRALRHLEVQA